MITNAVDLAGHAFPVLPEENTLQFNQINLPIQPTILQEKACRDKQLEMGMLSYVDLAHKFC